MGLKCQCLDCGKTFRRGDEGDNEKYCLRCERINLVQDMSDEDYDAFDRSSYDSERISLARGENE